MEWKTVYKYGVGITWLIVFITSWIYCVMEYGYLFGVGLGWLPSLIVAGIVSAVWPAIVVVIGLGVAYLYTL